MTEKSLPRLLDDRGRLFSQRPHGKSAGIIAMLPLPSDSRIYSPLPVKAQAMPQMLKSLGLMVSIGCISPFFQI